MLLLFLVPHKLKEICTVFSPSSSPPTHIGGHHTVCSRVAVKVHESVLKKVTILLVFTAKSKRLALVSIQLSSKTVQPLKNQHPMKKTQKIWLLLFCLAVPNVRAEDQAGKADKDALKVTGGFTLRAAYDVHHYKANPYFMPSAIPAQQNNEKQQNFLFDVHNMGLGLEKGLSYGAHCFNFVVQSNIDLKEGFTLSRIYIDHNAFTVGITDTQFANLEACPKTLTGDAPGNLSLGKVVQATWKQKIAGGIGYAVGVEQAVQVDLNPGLTAKEKSDAKWANKSDIPALTANVRYEKNFGHVQFGSLLRVADFYNKVDHKTTYHPTFGFNGSSAINIIPEKTTLKLYGIYGVGAGSYTLYCKGLPKSKEESVDVYFEDPLDQTKLASIHIRGGYVGVEHRWIKQLRSTVVYGFTDTSDKDKRKTNDFHQEHFASGNLTYHPTDHITIGFEYLFGACRQVEHDDFLMNHRLQGAVSFKL